MNLVMKKDGQNGSSDCKNASRSISSHEISAAHKNALMSLTVRAKDAGRVDCNLAKQIDEEWGHYATLVFIEKPSKIVP